MATYRTRTYIAGDWDHDKDAVDQLHKWNDSNHWSLSFTDAHDLTSANDSSLNLLWYIKFVTLLSNGI